ncbi:OLC1v1014568C1 [Oldenlandia corymbosa var. corymbosa]|uniref:OLC1v1014568C1 n=1 Tax=Oldenlandia corymbosa var. corymbosa TaxID=529605 RepID=A0AAV1E0Z7_OLDCO|nr:OLC1v1014568C1 [Oldenlandia corymbosa var. corymbosa]
MSGALRSVNQAETEVRPVLGPAGNNKSRSAFEPLRKPLGKPKVVSVNKTKDVDGKKSPVVTPDSSPSPKKKTGSAVATVMRQQKRQEVKLFSNLSMNASCSSDASTDSSQSRASTGRISLRSVRPTPIRRKSQCGLKTEKVEKFEKFGCELESPAAGEYADDFLVAKKRCAWVTPNTDPAYIAFHDEEWGVPEHDDKKLFELLSLSTALAELTWPVILNKRETFREVFQNFDPVAVSKLNEKKLTAPGSPASTLLSELKLRAIVENARQTCKVIAEFGSFDQYVWGFVNYKPIVGQFRYPRQIPIKTSKAEFISKDLVRRGFRGIGPTVVYSFMQVAGITNDHLISCFRFADCSSKVNGKDKADILVITAEEKQLDDPVELGIERALEGFSLSS